MSGSTARPYLPPSIEALQSGEDGTTVVRRLAEERMRNIAFDAGLKRGLEDGLAQGRAEGATLAEAEAARQMEAEMARNASLGANLAARALGQLLDARAEDRRLLDTDTRAAVLAALEAVLPALLATAAGAEIAALVAEVLAERGEDIILLTAHPDTLAAMRRDGFPAPQTDPPRLRLLPEPAMPPGSAEASWVSGGLIYRPDALVARALAILGPPHAPATPPDTLQETRP
jgi:flagellar biosynthesis/type III secretory pathway protein FliH